MAGVQKIAETTINVGRGGNHATGIIPFDLDHDGHTDLLFAPSQFNTGSDQPIVGVLASSGQLRAAPTTVPTLTSGFVKDWIIADLTGDQRADILLVDHGLELPGGNELGFNRVVTATASQIADTGALMLPRAFYHSAAVGDLDGDGDLDLVLQKFDSSPLAVAVNSGGRFAIRDQPGAFGSNGAAAPGAVGIVDTPSGPLVVAASYISAPSQSAGTIQGFRYTDGALDRAFSIPFPASWASLGAYQIVVGDFRGVGSDDFIVIAESSLAANVQQWMYLKADGNGFVDATTEMLVNLNPQVSLPSKLMPIDVNGDGRLDLVGFSWDSAAAAEDRLIWLNNGAGFVRATTSKMFAAPGVIVPQFKTDENGNWLSVEGFFQVALTSLTDVKITQYALTDPGALGVVRPVEIDARIAAAYANILRFPFSGGASSLEGKLRVLSDALRAGQDVLGEAIDHIVEAAGMSTSVALMAYQFFTGKIPTEAGVDYLVSPNGPNPNNLNSAYYAKFNLENRYINFAMNLGREGDGKAWFDANYGGRDIYATASEAYRTIFGTPADAAKARDLVDPRLDFFKSFSGEEGNGQGTKAALVGWLIAEAVKADIGVYAETNNAFLRDLADGAVFGVDLVGISGG